MIKPRITSRTTTAGILNEILVLFKVRIVLLLLFAAFGGAFLGAEGLPRPGPFAILFVTGALAAMGSSALNEYLEKDRDALMVRTRRRPLVTGRIPHAQWVPVAAAAMIAAPVLATLPSNPALSVFLALGAFTYVVIYTVWLKPRTSLNIVVGGLAGSFAVMSGGAAVHRWTDPGVVLLAALLFFWTPIHFWALALVYREDYARAGVPMLPVKTSARSAALWGLLHGVCAGLSALALALRPGLGPLYLGPVLAVTVALLVLAGDLVARPSRHRAWRLFHASNTFLAVVLLAICASLALGVPWPGT